MTRNIMKKRTKNACHGIPRNILLSQEELSSTI